LTFGEVIPVFVNSSLSSRMGRLLLAFAIMGILSAASRADTPLPRLGCWFWQEGEFEPGGFRSTIDLFAERSLYTHLTASIRSPDKEVTHDDVVSQIAQSAAYARERGLEIVMDLDVRLARQAFWDAYPSELQQMARVREVEIGPDGKATLEIQSEDLSDHYTFRAKHYISMNGTFLRGYTYNRSSGAIAIDSVRELRTDEYRVEQETVEAVRVTFNLETIESDQKVCAIVAFTHFTPDVFAPHLLEFQRSILEKYQKAGLAGACKDEWGFPPDYHGCPEKNDYWFSPARSEVYSNRTGGRDALRDFVLMTFGEEGRERERQGCINHWLEMSRLRNGEVETDFYEGVKETFGPDGIVATHPTWFPHPNAQEFKKNGLHWWIAKRDFAQTDEATPYCVRTALSKKWNSPVWYNMYYSQSVPDYESSIWSYALAGGRMNVHPIYPPPDGVTRLASYDLLLDERIGTAMRRMALLDRITNAPVDSPVAVLFGQACAMNWAGPHYADTGTGLADLFWKEGVPADLIPTSEIHNGSVTVDPDGSLRYGPQKYAAAVLFHPEFENPGLAEFLRAVHPERTELFRVGDWTATFEGAEFDGNSALPPTVTILTNATDMGPVFDRLREKGVENQTGATETLRGFGYSSLVLPPKGRCLLLDGTVIFVSGATSVAGDPIHETFEVGGQEVKVEAEGLFAIRLGKDGEVDAFAAGGLRNLHCGDLAVVLDEPVDLACWRDEEGEFVGLWGGTASSIPESLQGLTEQWGFLSR
jgi:hypothetical protein